MNAVSCITSSECILLDYYGVFVCSDKFGYLLSVNFVSFIFCFSLYCQFAFNVPEVSRNYYRKMYYTYSQYKCWTQVIGMKDCAQMLYACSQYK